MAAPNTGNSERLKFDTKEVSYEWTIDDFTTNEPHMKNKVESQTFPRKGLPKWFIRLRPRGDTNGTETRKFCVYLMLKKAESGEKSVVVDFNLQFLDDDGTEIEGIKESGTKFDEGSGEGFGIESDSDDPIPLSTLGHLNIRVTIIIRKPMKSVSFRSAIEIPNSSLNGDLMKLLKTTDFADFIVESADGQEFPVYRGILSARNPHFFASMFTSGMKEARDRVKLPFEGEIVSAMLEYLYSDEVVNLTSTAARLYPVAHQYQLNRLVLICAENLRQNLTVANISVSLGIAKLYGDVKLQSACEKFMNARQSDVVQMVSAAAFNDDSDPKLDGS